jgi:hypothetical protein
MVKQVNNCAEMDEEERRKQFLNEVEAEIDKIDKATASLPRKIANFFRKSFRRQVSSSTICVEVWNLLCLPVANAYE